MTDNKQTVSWVYNLDKEGLSLELHNIGLSIAGNFAVLRERLLKAIRSSTKPLETSPQPSNENLDHLDPLIDPPLKNSNFDHPIDQPLHKISIATQTDMDFSDFHMLDDLIEAGQLPGYTSDLISKQKPGSDVDSRAKVINRNIESSNTIRDTRCEGETRVYDCRDDLNYPQPGHSGYRRTDEPERNSAIFSRN